MKTARPKNRIAFHLQLLVFWIALILLSLNNAHSQEEKSKPTVAVSDSSSEDDWSDETFYEIEMLRLERWIIENTEKLADPVLLEEVFKLKKEAETFAESQDYAMAIIWVETIWDLLQPDEDGMASEVDSEYLGDINNGFSDPSTRRFSWSKEVISGVDIWRYQSQFSLPRVDGIEITSFDANGGNPFTGFRLSFDYSKHSRNSLQGYTSFKYSRDYLSGELDLRLKNPVGEHSFWMIGNRFSGNSFYRDNDLKYLQNTTTVALSLRRFGPVSLNFEEEFLIRRYADERSIYPNYYYNALKGFLKVNTGSASSIGVGWRNVHQLHPEFDLNDYIENRIDARWVQKFGDQTSLSVENELRFRDYTNAPADTFFQDFKENYLIAELRLPFHRNWGVELDGSFTYRDYKLLNVNSLPDYLLWEIEPQVYFKIGAEWRIGAGAVYRNQSHQELFDRLSSINANADAARSIVFEDYFGYG
ncbi:hypothetical protein GWO43_30385, partial [candidate division KSB1 bacterium]|nr:hypothetical protein [candidate division KSB1 bacterium]NIR68630.1 hypothetical protein [candidate division KSB1 bacterium]NIS28200.1 hypothetical protein [candidate division KSB1 bacterium]NIT75091.1 hypothetical protein [candidate division KSB1 bacterium]NIU28876.1 hypothetical protein [candidate division KSB1 bacterium]